MKKRTSSMSRRIVSLLMSLVLTLTLVTPAAFATEVVGGSGTAIIEGNANPADANPNEDTEGKDDENKDTEHGGDEQPTNPGDEDKNPGEGEGDDANKPAEDNKGEENPDGDKKDEENKDEQPTEEPTDEIDTLEVEGTTPVAAEPNIEWYTKDKAAKKFTISNETELLGLAQLVNGEAKETAEDGTTKDIGAINFSDCEIVLANDIDLSAVCHPADESGAAEVNWTPIGNDASHAFAGTFDGNGHTIEGLYINETGKWSNNAILYKGLFGNSSGVIKNVAVTGNIVVDNEELGRTNTRALTIKGVGGIVGTHNETVLNCGFSGTVKVQGKTKNGNTGYMTANNGGVVGIGPATNCWYYTTWSDSNNKLGVCGGTPTNCYHNVPKHTGKKGTLIESKSFVDFAAAAADELNAYAFEYKLPMWSASESALVIDMNLKYDAVVKLAAGVEGSVVAGKVGFGDSLAQSKLGKNNEPLTLTAAEGTDKVCYTLKKPTEGVAITKDDLVELSAGYTVNAENADEKGVITLYYGTEDELMADLTESGWYYKNTAGNYYNISTSKELRFLATLVNDKHINFFGKTINLTKTIDLSDIEDWTPIGKDTDHPFAGKFNGAGSNYSISGLNGDLFGVVKGSIESVNISGGKGRLVGTLESGGTVKNCMSTATAKGGDENAAVGGLVGTAVEGATVSGSYYYNKDSMGTLAVGGNGSITNCFYLADQSTFGSTADENGENGDTGARTEDEFAAGRVTWELNGKADGFKGRNTYLSWGMSDNEPKVPKLARIKVGAPGCVYELTLTKVYAPPAKDIRLEGGEGVTVFQNGDTWYAYCVLASNKTFSVKVDTTTLESGDMVTYGTNGEPTKITRIEASAEAAKNAYFYTIGGKIEADIDWYVGHENEDTYILKNAAEMFGFAALVNGTAKDKDGKEIPSKGFDGKTVELANDIDLSNCPWTPIGFTDSIVFQGTFNGGGHRVKGLLVAANIRYAGLFGRLKGAGTVRNVQVEGSVDATYTSGGTFYVGGIVGQLAGSGTVSNCLSKVDVTATSSNNAVSAGGVVGDAVSGSKINLCWNEGSVQVTGVVVGSAVGGVVGSAATATNCANFGEVKGSSAASGIVGRGAVANSYNLGDVTGTEGRAYGISSGAAVNSYYLCKLNGAVEQKYIKDSSSEAQNITATTEDNKTVYKVDGTELVELLNKNRSTYTEWINKQEAPNNPVHITRWDGSFEPGVKGVITLVYDPNGGEGAAVTEQQRVEGDTDGSFTIKSDMELGFKHENGTFLGWSKTAGGEVAFKLKNDGSITPASVSVKKDETLTLYAVWSPIWAGSGTEAAPYEIPDVGKLTALQTQVNENGFSYTGKWFRLTNNIDLNNELWTPIGVDALHSFGGSLDGGGKTISGLKVETNGAWAGLFGSVRGTYGVPMTMRDLTLKNGSVKFTSSGTSYSGGLVAAVEGETVLELRNVVAENLTVSGGIFGSGGLLGRGRVAMTNCHNRGGSVTGGYAGGLAGMGYSNLQDHVLAGCTNSAKVVGKRTAGGMTGNETHSDGSYTSCANSGSISATQGYASGIAAGGSYERCSNSGAVTGKEAAGICVNGSKATNCSNTGAVTGTGTGTGTGYAAGILTNDGYGGTVEFCWNTGSVEASTPVKAFGILYGRGAYNRVRNSFSYVPGANIGLAPTELKEKNVSDSYYLADKKDSVSSAGEWASADDFASGKVAWGVDGSVNAHKNYWTQGGSGYPIPIGEGTSTSYYRAQVTCGTGGTATIKRGDGRTGDADNAVYGPSGIKVTVTATPKDSSFALKSLTLDLMSTGTTSDLANPGSFALGAANAKVVATFASAGSGGGSGSGSGSGSGAGTGDENDEGLQDGMNMDVEYNIKGLVLSTYTEWGSNGGKTFSQWLKDSPNVLRALIANSLDNMAAAAAAKKTDEASALAQALLASLNEHSGVAGKDGDAISKALQRFMTSGTEATFSTWLATSSGMASGTLESIFTQYTDSLLALADRLYTKWESSGTSMTFPAWLDAQQVSMENLSETAEEPDTDTTDESQTTEAPEDVPDGQESEGQVSGNSIWEIIGTAVRENPIIVWSIVAVVAALVIVGAVRRYHKVKRDERDDNGAE